MVLRTWTLLACALPTLLVACGDKEKERRDRRDEEPPQRKDPHAADIADAKSKLDAIARGTVAAYQRTRRPPQDVLGDLAEHRLCESVSWPKPRTMPAGGKQAVPEVDDPDASHADRGEWPCLGFVLSTPTRFQYDYRKGGKYKGPARGGPDPGMDGFEASAEADLDGDGKKTTLITITGKVNEEARSVELAPEAFVASEL